jgi:outer membrane protein insertion porin family
LFRVVCDVAKTDKLSTSWPVAFQTLLTISATVATLAPLAAQAAEHPELENVPGQGVTAKFRHQTTPQPATPLFPTTIAQSRVSGPADSPDIVQFRLLPGSQTSTVQAQNPATPPDQLQLPTAPTTTPPSLNPGATPPTQQTLPQGAGDPNTPTPDPNAPAADPNAPAQTLPAPDPNAPAVDPNAPPADPNAPPVNPNAPAVDPNAPPADPNAAPPAPADAPPGAPMDAPPAGETPPADGTADGEPEKEVLVSEVAVQSAEGGELPPDLVKVVYDSLQNTRPGLPTTRTQLQVDINAIFATGYFNNVRAEPSDTPLGVKVTFIVTPNPVLRTVQVAGNKILPQEEVDKLFQPSYGRTLNLIELRNNIKSINKYYQDKGYILGQVLEGATQISPDGTVTLQVAEGIVERIDIRFQSKEGEPKKGKTRPFILTREMKTKPGEVINKDVLQKDLQRVFGLGLFEDLQPSFEPGEDPRKVALTLNVKERSTGNFSAGAGFSSNSGLFGTASYSQNNLGGNNQKINTQIQIGTREYLFDASFTDPWIATDPYRTSYTVNLFNRLTRPLVFDGGTTDINLGTTGVVSDPDGVPNSGDEVTGLVDSGNTPRVNRLGGGVTFSRPFTKDIDKVRTAWTASAGIQYQRVSIRDEDFDINNIDELGNSLSFSGTGQDDLLTVQLGLSRDLRNDPQTPTKGSVIRVGLDQSVPVGLGSITMTRLRASYSHFFPVKLVNFAKGPQALAFNVQAGTVLGDLPPYEAFSLGGSNSVRGYGEGEVGSGRSFVQASAEYRFPLLKFLGGIGGVLFVDFGSNLGTQDEVPGNPGIIRGKQGWGLGYGVGVRIKTPIGPVRLDYGWNDQGESRFQFGFGERF